MLLITAVGVKGASLENTSCDVAPLSCWLPEDGGGAVSGAVFGSVGGVTGFSWTCKKRRLPRMFQDTGSPQCAVLSQCPLLHQGKRSLILGLLTPSSMKLLHA